MRKGSSLGMKLHLAGARGSGVLPHSRLIVVNSMCVSKAKSEARLSLVENACCLVMTTRAWILAPMWSTLQIPLIPSLEDVMFSLTLNEHPPSQIIL